MTDRVLTRRELNRATLARQLLLERASRPALDAVAHLAGLQAQLANPPYIGLWSRLQSFRRFDLTGLLEGRQVVRATLMRATLHLLTAEDYLGFRPGLQPALTRALHAFFGQQAKSLDIARLVAAARAYVEEQPRTFVELRAMLAALDPDHAPEALAYAVRTHLPLVQVPPGGIWGYGGSPAHTLAESWLGRPLAAPAPGPLVHRYLAAFGPATVQDIQTWSGLAGLRAAIATLKPELRTYRAEGGHELLDLPDAPLPPAETPAPPRFLPEFDNLILSHADRTRVVPDTYRPAIFLSAGRVRATFLVDGFVAGTWRIKRLPGQACLVAEPFAPLADEVRDALAEEGERLVRFVEDDPKRVEVQFAASV